MKNYEEFVNEKVSIYNGDFKVTKDMVSNGKLIKDMIPREVIGSFHCSKLKLTTLKGSPEEVSGYFDCSDNQLTTLKGCPRLVSRFFYCYGNSLTSLEGGPKSVGGSFHCPRNKVDLEIEKTFIESGKYKDNYWMDLLKYMTDNHIDLTEITSWPKDFLTPELIQSVKGISKFKL